MSSVGGVNAWPSIISGRKEIINDVSEERGLQRLKDRSSALDQRSANKSSLKRSEGDRTLEMEPTLEQQQPGTLLAETSRILQRIKDSLMLERQRFFDVSPLTLPTLHIFCFRAACEEEEPPGERGGGNA